jgi:parvulin-like peptidyl-prolyl isomerase
MLNFDRALTGLALLVLSPVVLGAGTESTATTAAADDATSTAVVAVVNGEPIYLEDVEGTLGAMHETVADTDRTDFQLEQLMFRVVNDALLAQEARALGFDEDPRVQAKLAGLRERLAVETLERREIWEPATATEEEVRRSFAERYRTVTLRLATTHDREEAEALLERARAGEDLETLAREHSVDPYGPRGGLATALPRADLLMEVAEAAFAAEVGELVGPVVTPIGWTLLRVEAFGEADPERFAAVERNERSVVRMHKGEDLRAALVGRIQEAHPISIERGAVAAIVPERLPDGRLKPRVDDPEAVVARIGTRVITAAQYGGALFGRWSGVRNEVAAVAAAPIVLDKLVAREILLAEALRRGYDRLPEVERRAAALERRLLVERALREVVAAEVEVTPEEMEAWYAENKGSLKRPPRVHASQITTATAEEAAQVAELARQGADFAWLARRHSIDRFKDLGGDRGWMDPGTGTGAQDDELLTAAPGDVLGPFDMAENNVVMKVNAIQDQGIYSLEEAGGNVRQAVFATEFQRVLDRYLHTLRERSEIDVRSEALEGLAISGTRSDEAARPGAGHGQ